MTTGRLENLPHEYYLKGQPFNNVLLTALVALVAVAGCHRPFRRLDFSPHEMRRVD